MPGLPAAGTAKGRNRGPRLTARESPGQEHGIGSQARTKGLGSYSGFESFPLCYTAGRHEGARREARVELMKETADRAVLLLLQRASELLIESRAVSQQLEVIPDGESSADAADRIAYGILAAALEEGLVTTLSSPVDSHSVRA